VNRTVPEQSLADREEEPLVIELEDVLKPI
jgi:hypothetical protein